MNSLPGFSRSKIEVSGNSDDINSLMITKIDELVDELGLSEDLARAILMKNKWNVGKAVTAFAKDPDYIENNFKCELAPEDSTGFPGYKLCGVCFCEYGSDEWITIKECGHGLCQYCFTGYLESKIGDGRESIFTFCPEAGCNMTVPDYLFKALLSEKQYTRYQKFSSDAFVDM